MDLEHGGLPRIWLTYLREEVNPLPKQMCLCDKVPCCGHRLGKQGKMPAEPIGDGTPKAGPSQERVHPVCICRED